jgi:uncharacterized membrane protein YkvA (DUF1232 family)
MIVLYVLLPFDLLPEKVLGFIGFIDDILFILYITLFMMTLVGLRYYQEHAV